MTKERMRIVDRCDARMIRAGSLQERMRMCGWFDAELYDKDGKLKWAETFPNTVMIEGENFLLDSGFAGVGYTVTGPFLGLIAATGFGSIVDTDTQASHAGWVEAGLAVQPTYTGNRQTMAFSAAAGGAKAMNPALTYTFSNVALATVKGAFVVYGTGASAVKDTTTGKLWSAGLFQSGDRDVIFGDQLVISYSMAYV